MTRSCYFGELDPFTGSIPQIREHLPYLARTFKILILLDHIVIIPPGSLLEHGLALPAFEKLAPLVELGWIGTSADHNAPRPQAYFLDRIQQYSDRLFTKGTALPSTHWMRDEVKKLQERWQEILPHSWRVRRSVRAQVMTTTHQVLQDSQRLDNLRSTTIGHNLEKFIWSEFDKGRDPDRNRLLSYLGSQRAEANPMDLAVAVKAIQSSYFSAGGLQQDIGSGAGVDSVLFPGRFARILRNDPSGKILLEQIPYDWNLAPDMVHGRAKDLNIDFDALARLPPLDVLALLQNDAWKIIASLLRGETDDQLDVEELRARSSQKDIRDVVSSMPTFDKPAPEGEKEFSPAPTLVFSPWTLGAEGSLAGTLASPDLFDDSDILDRAQFDWATSIFQHAGSSLPEKLTRIQSHLLTLLILAGEIGLSVNQMKAALLELDTADSPVETEVDLPDPLSSYDKALRDRIDVHCHQLREILIESQYHLVVEESRWYLTPPTLSIINTPWDCQEEFTPPAPPEGLPDLLRRAWEAVAAGGASGVPVSAVAEHMGIGDRIQPSVEASKALDRLRRWLWKHRCRWTLNHIRRGWDLLVPLPPS